MRWLLAAVAGVGLLDAGLCIWAGAYIAAMSVLASAAIVAWKGKADD